MSNSTAGVWLYRLELGSPTIIPGYNKEIHKEFAWSS